MLFSTIAEAQTPQTILITSPTQGDIFQPGTTINITVDTQPAGPMNGVGITGTIFDLNHDFGAPPLFSPPYSFAIDIPDDAPNGSYSIIALGKTVDGRSLKSETVNITIESSVDPLSLNVEFKAPHLKYQGDRMSLRVYGNMLNGQRVYFDESHRLQCQSTNPAVAVVVTPPCAVVAVGEGSATVTATVGGVSTTVPVEVKLSIRGDFDGDEDVDSDDIGFLTSWRNTVPAPTGDGRDLNNDKKIDALDMRVLTTLCTRPRCATY